ELAHRWCCDHVRRSDTVRLIDDPKVYIDAPKIGGFRGMIQKTEIAVAADHFPYELQLLTYLQHTWDQLQHRFYELLRASKGERTEAQRKIETQFEEMSRRLIEEDRAMDALRTVISS